MHLRLGTEPALKGAILTSSGLEIGYRDLTDQRSSSGRPS